MKLSCLDCPSGMVDFFSDDITFITATDLESTCDKCGVKWTLRELLHDRDENCDSCGYSAKHHPNQWCEIFKPKVLENK